MKSPEESDLYIITPLHYDFRANPWTVSKQQMSKTKAVYREICLQT